MYTPVHPSFTTLKREVRGYKSHGHVILMNPTYHNCILDHGGGTGSARERIIELYGLFVNLIHLFGFVTFEHC